MQPQPPLRLLGVPRVSLAGEPCDVVPDKPVLLLFYLAYHGDWLSREALAFLFWPDEDEFVARRNLRQLLHRAKEFSWAAGLEVEPRRLRFAPETDVGRFREAVAWGDWAGALEAYGGPLLEGVGAATVPGYEAWLALERESLHNAWRDAVTRQGKVLEEAGRYGELARLAKRLLDADVLAEDVLQTYLRSSYLAGQREAALRAYEGFAARLRAELELEPLEATQALVRTIRRAEPLGPAPAGAHEGQAVPLAVLRPPRLVGREAERTRVAAAPVPVVLLAGEPGVGKSRLMAELAPEAPVFRAQEGLEAVPYHPLTQAIHARLEQQLPMPDLGGYLEDLVRLVPALAPELTPSPLEAQASRARLLEALARYLKALAGPGGVLCFDDLQWSDAATLELLVYLSGRKGLRLLGAYRRGEVAPALARCLESLRLAGRLAVVPLHPFGEAELARLLADLMGEGEGPPLFSRWLHQSTGGNPMFVLETLRAMFEVGVLREGERGWQSSVDDLTQDYREFVLPQAVAELIEKRVCRLSDGARRVLQAAAVVRGDFAPRLLAQISGLSEWAVTEALEEAEAAALVHGTGFAHDLLRQAVYSSLSEARRRLLHGQVAGAIGDRADPAVVAEHWLEAGEAARAVPLWLKAADSLQARALLAEAAALLERAALHAPNASLRVKLKVRLAEAYREAGRYAEAQTLLAQVFAEDLDVRTRADASIEWTYVLLNLGQLEAAADSAAEAGRLIATLEDWPLELSLAKLSSNVAFRRERFAEACALLEPVVARLRRGPPSKDLAGVLTSLGAGYDSLGRFGEALSFHREALAIARTIGAHYYHVDAASNLLNCLRELGRVEEGLEAAETALNLGQYEGSDYLRNSLAVAYGSLGRDREAILLSEHLAQRSEVPSLRALAWIRLAELYTRTGRLTEVEGALERALESAGKGALGVRVVVAVLRYGTPGQHKRVKPLLDGLEPGRLSPALRAQLEQALTVRDITSM